METADLIDKAAKVVGGLGSLAERLVYKERTLKRIRSGEFPLNDRLRQTLEKIAEESPIYRKRANAVMIAQPEEIDIPLLTFVQGGPPIDFEVFTGEDVDTIKFSGKDRKAFALRLTGDSMMPRFEPGMVIIVSPSIAPANGDLVVATLREEGSLFKLFHHTGDSKLVTLTSYNPAYPPIERPREAFHTIFPVLEARLQLKRS